jgi:hypothetical protein
VARHIATTRSTVCGRFSRQRAQHDVAVHVEIGQRGIDAARLAARDRMARHELADPRAERRARGRDHVGLGAARIGDDRADVEVRRDALEQRLRLRDRRREQHEVRAGERRAQPGVIREGYGAVDHTERQRAPARRGRPPDADHRAHPTRFTALTQRASERSADQADTENHQLVKRKRGHVAHTIRTYARRTCRPDARNQGSMLTRRQARQAFFQAPRGTLGFPAAARS